MLKKKCSVCEKTKPIDQFTPDKRHKSGRYSACKKCHNESSKKSRIRNPFGTLKYNAAARDIDIGLDRTEYHEWVAQSDRVCHYCGVTETDLFQTTRKRKRLTVDRRDNTVGYRLDNIVLACSRCNIIKSNFFTEQEMVEIAKKYIKPRLSEYHCLTDKVEA